MNTHVPPPKAEGYIRPQIPSEEFVRFLSTPDHEKAIDAYSGQLFDEANGHSKLLAARDAATHELAAAESNIEGAKEARAGMRDARSYPTNEIACQMSVSQRVSIIVGVLMVALDALLCVYTASSYMAASGILQDISSIAAAVPFTTIFLAGMYGIKAFADTIDNERIRARFVTCILAAGLVLVFAYVLPFAGTFNPASAQQVDPASVGSGVLSAGASISFGVATALIAAQLCSTMLLGAGIALITSEAIDRNKIRHVEISPELAEVARSLTVFGEIVAKRRNDLDAATQAIADHVSARNAYQFFAADKMRGFEVVRSLRQGEANQKIKRSMMIAAKAK